MKIVKRDMSVVDVRFDKIIKRIKDLYGPIDESYTDFPMICKPIDIKHVDPDEVAKKVIEGMCDMMTTQQLDDLAAEYAASKTVRHPDFAKLAARIMVSNIHKRTRDWSSFSRATWKMRNAISPTVSEKHYSIVMANAERLDAAIDYTMDYNYSHFGLRTLEHSYLIKIDGDRTLVERPQNMLMRVAVGIHGEDIDSAIETYEYLSKHYFTHASPTMFNAGTPMPQLSSCFLNELKEDSVDGIFATVHEVANISKSCGGIGLHIHRLRGEGSHISSSNNSSPGVMPFMRVFNETIKTVSQGGNKRKGALAFYFEPWHIDVVNMVECRRTNGNENIRTRDIFPALWIPDLFMKRVRSNSMWSLMCPAQCPGLSDVYGDEFERLYTHYEGQGLGKKVSAQDIWRTIINSKIETGAPYICFKDTVNRRSNHSNIGIIKSSNLCTEIVQYSDPKHTAVCNLASLALNRFLKKNPETSKLEFDFDKLKTVVKIMVKNLDRVVDVTAYPTKEARSSNMDTRPMGLGVQGLADLFFRLHIPFVSDKSRVLNKQIFETIYYAALESSCELAEKKGAYPKYEGSPISKGIFHFEMEGGIGSSPDPDRMHNWEVLRAKIRKHGVRNSMLVAPMPTASTAQILGNNESFEPCTSNMMSRIVLSGPCQVVNEYMVKDLVDLGLWDTASYTQIAKDRGSVKNVKGLPEELKEIYKTVWEMKQRDLMSMAVDRGQYIDQAQSFNIYAAKPAVALINKMLFYAWEHGLKTLYYLRTRPATNPVQFAIDKTLLVNKDQDKDGGRRDGGGAEKQRKQAEQDLAKLVCSRENPEGCIACSG